MEKKFKQAFNKVDEKLSKGNGQIDFDKSSINKKKEKRKNRMQTYLTDSEHLKFAETMKPLEKPAERIRELLLADIEKRLKG